MKQNYEQYLITAGGRIKCHRCQARSSRKKQQCSKPALRGKSVCGTHGGLSTGPKTAAGIKRIQSAHWKHGNETKEARAARRRMSLMFQRLEEIGWHVGLFATDSTKTRGRKVGSKLDLYQEEQLLVAIHETVSNKKPA
jgi:hypothetical protein